MEFKGNVNNEIKKAIENKGNKLEQLENNLHALTTKRDEVNKTISNILDCLDNFEIESIEYNKLYDKYSSCIKESNKLDLDIEDIEFKIHACKVSIQFDFTEKYLKEIEEIKQILINDSKEVRLIEEKRIDYISNQILILGDKLEFLLSISNPSKQDIQYIKTIKERIKNYESEKNFLIGELTRINLNKQLKEVEYNIEMYELKLENLQDRIDYNVSKNKDIQELQSTYKVAEKKLNRLYSKKQFLYYSINYKRVIVKSKDCLGCTSYFGYIDGQQYTDGYDSLIDLKEENQYFKGAKLISL